MPWFDWHQHVGDPVEVVTSNEDGGMVRRVFPDLAAAQRVYPTLNPEVNGPDFTWACRGSVDGRPVMRFEDWETYQVLST